MPEMTQYEKIKNWMNQLKKLDRDSYNFTSMSILCSDRITWAYRWKKITQAQMSELCDEMVRIFEGDY